MRIALLGVMDLPKKFPAPVLALWLVMLTILPDSLLTRMLLIVLPGSLSTRVMLNVLPDSLLTCVMSAVVGLCCQGRAIVAIISLILICFGIAVGSLGVRFSFAITLGLIGG